MTVASIVWYCVGVASFAFWWTREFDLEIGDLLPMLIGGVLGPFAFLGGWLIHGEHVWCGKVLLRRRGRK